MRSSVRLIALPILLLLPSAPGWSNPTPEPPRDEVVVEGERQKKVCKRSVSTGSIMPQRICKSADEWDKITERSVAALERMRKEQEERRYLKEALENR